MKALIFDASSLISMSMAGLISQLKDLKKIFNGKFYITEQVKKEVIDKPLTIKRFELEALRIKQLLEEKILELPQEKLEGQITEKTKQLMNIANNSFYTNKRNIHLISDGETSCLALSEILTENKIQNLIVVDERTMRMLVEKPKNLKDLFRKKLHTDIKTKNQNFKEFENFKIIRSTELIYIAYKKNLFKIKDNLLLDAVLFALKFKGCAISGDEIQEMKKL